MHKLNEGAVEPIRAHKSLVGNLAGLIVQYSKVLSSDLSAFASHAGRKNVNLSDVMLCARKSASLTARLNEKIRGQKISLKKGRGNLPLAGAGKPSLVQSPSAGSDMKRVVHDGHGHDMDQDSSSDDEDLMVGAGVDAHQKKEVQQGKTRGAGRRKPVYVLSSSEESSSDDSDVY